ncbi:tripartite tricarboxylate transporter TctB family protein [Oceanicola sp. 502str15]|uniref:tripartite tricarboxylate transporter TctB family protein n=1 Tax=Oceanicola sp. 502str15 TaxID=2696061 RepID=UPI002094DFE9|nr:tripartite tricarboxylate transporter TctB family protein [Oceanicola sp. 502str15]MCO6383036.1 tripartite tricarboxylate transporter TctB family protein [Oceanicola sp. 502str15]
MYRIDYVDIVGGALLVLFGVAVTYTSVTFYPMGTPSRMGPGMFPAGLGVVLVVLGLLLALQALRRPGPRPDVRIFSPLFILGGIAAFAAIIVPFGLIPAIVAILVISSLADLRIRPVSLVISCIGLSLFAPFVFVFLLGLQIPLLRWPF